MKLLRLFFVALLFLARGASAQELPDLTVQLGTANIENGLSVPSGGDGENAPTTVGGIGARRMIGEKSSYLYVVINSAAYQGPRDLYVTIEAFDDQFGRATLQYDKAAPVPNIQTKYSTAQGALFLTNSGTWRTATFYLPQARLGHGQNFNADFRLVGHAIAVRRITVSARRPADFDANVGLDTRLLDNIRTQRLPGMEFTIGDDHVSAPVGAFYNALGASSVETYVTWQSVEAQKDKWNWSEWDEKVAALKTAKLKWVPFLIAGPAYATPLWFQNSEGSRFTKCLEHNENSRIQSIFNPALRPQIDRFIKAFAARYGQQNVIESVLLGVSGTYGESIYAAGPFSGWTAGLTGDYHNHFGWWAADADAQNAFRVAMQKRYGKIAALNAAWGTHFESWDKVSAFLPAQAPNDRARADFAEWYQQAMTDWSVFWVQTTRKYFPQTEIYLCTGGDGNPQLGADFTAQAKSIAPFGAGIRITNEGSDYARNFTVTREVATSTRLYKTFCGFEPASEVSPAGVAARVYNATASGARQLHDYAPNSTLTQESIEVLRRSIPFLVPRTPIVNTAVYLPRESWPFEPEGIRRVYDIAARLRDITDVDFITRQSVADGVLRGKSAVLLAEADVLEPQSAAALEKWVQNGGVLVAATRKGQTLGGRLYDNSAWRKRLFSDATRAPQLLSPSVSNVPPRWIIKIGSSDDENWLFGDWHNREKGGEWPTIEGATKRWSGANAGVYLPIIPGKDATLKLSLFVPREALPGEIAVNGQTLQKIGASGLQEIEVRLPAALLTQNLARLELRAKTWKPSDKNAGDPRDLGVAVRQIEVMGAGGENSAPGTAIIQMNLDAAKLKPLMRQVGQGWTVFLPGIADNEADFAQVLASLWRDTPNYLSLYLPVHISIPMSKGGPTWRRLFTLAPLDGQLDGRFVTLFQEKDQLPESLWFDSKTATINVEKLDLFN